MLTRRDLILRSTIGAGFVATGNIGALFTDLSGENGYGPLRADPAGLLDLPARFSYSVVSRTGDALPGGGRTPSTFDGMGAFAGPRGAVRLVRNHELDGPPEFPAVAESGLTYDSGAGGGTTTLTLDRHNRRIDEYVSLAGTVRNCAGGLTPWATWLTCEESEQTKGGSYRKDHGYVFEVDPADRSNNVDPTPLYGLGRFAHEAAAVDPATGSVYLTEDADNPHGLVYRFVPNDPLNGYGSLRNGGVLSAMICHQVSTPVADLCVFQEIGTALAVDWVAVPDPLALARSTRKQFSDGQVTRSRKLEGAWWADGRAYIVCSYARVGDGSAVEHDGQVWSYDPAGQTLRLEARFGLNPDPAGRKPDGPDNITVSPWGGLMLAEDGAGVQHLYAVTPDGVPSPFARNALNDNEFAGICFAPDRRTLFASIQTPGVTFAITGPFALVRRR